MPSYTIENGADCRVAVYDSGRIQQEVDIWFVLQCPVVPGYEKRYAHLKKLYEAMIAIPEKDLPKRITIED